MKSPAQNFPECSGDDGRDDDFSDVGLDAGIVPFLATSSDPLTDFFGVVPAAAASLSPWPEVDY